VKKLMGVWLVLESSWMLSSVDEVIMQGTYVQKDQVTLENVEAALAWLCLSYRTDQVFRGILIAPKDQAR
jgi:hypothetical protein